MQHFKYVIHVYLNMHLILKFKTINTIYKYYIQRIGTLLRHIFFFFPKSLYYARKFLDFFRRITLNIMRTSVCRKRLSGYANRALNNQIHRSTLFILNVILSLSVCLFVSLSHTQRVQNREYNYAVQNTPRLFLCPTECTCRVSTDPKQNE